MQTPDPSTAAGQIQMRRTADQKVLTVCRTFNDIQTSDNPLTPTEVRKLIEKRPAMYGVLEAWASPVAG
jgi:hypothetical protein